MFLIIQLTILGVVTLNTEGLIILTMIPLVVIGILIAVYFVTTGVNGEKVKVDIQEKEVEVETLVVNPPPILFGTNILESFLL